MVFYVVYYILNCISVSILVFSFVFFLFAVHHREEKKTITLK